MFQTSTPVVGKGFHNREAELDVLAGAIRRLTSGAPQWVAILGPRKIGKTSLVLEAARRAQSSGLRIVTLDVQEQGPPSREIFRRLTLRLLDAALGGELGESLERLALDPPAYRGALQRSKRFGEFPAALRSELLELVEEAASPERVRAWLDVPERLAEVLQVRFVIALDEFQDLEGLAAARQGFNPFTLMRGVWQRHRRVAYFISGSARSMLLTLINSEQSPFFHHFTILDLGPFHRDAAVALLQVLSPPHQQISSEVAGRAVETLGGHPFYLQLLGEALTARARAPGLPDLKDAMQGLLFSRTGRLALYFDHEFQRLVGRSTTLAATLDALAEGPATLTAVAARIRASSGATVHYLERLKDAVVRSAEERYELADPTFAVWLRWRLPGGTVVPMTVVGNEAEQAVARALSAMGFDLVYQSRASRGAFDLLATRGATQLGVQVKRSALPLRFTRAEWSRMVAEGERLHWRWVLAAVDPGGAIVVLDPAKARRGDQVRVDRGAEIGNLLLWLDTGAGLPRDPGQRGTASNAGAASG
jgi:Holliday junction resolvase